jgi:Zn-dependent protease
MEFNLDPLTLVITIVSILIGLTLHEMMHAFAGLKLGDTTAHEQGRISFNPLDHIDPFMTLKWDEFGAAIIAAAGPFTNLVLAVIGAAIAHGFSGSASVYNALSIFVALNVGLFIFNMIPIPPLDGSRVLYAFAPDAIREIMAQMEQYGIFIVFALILFIPQFGQILSSLNQSLSLFLL